MQNDRVTLGHLIEDIEGTPLRVHVVFRKDLKPVYRGLIGEDVPIVYGSQTHTES